MKTVILKNSFEKKLSKKACHFDFTNIRYSVFIFYLVIGLD